MKKETLTQDNFDPWSPLGLATAVILNRLRTNAQLLELASEQKEGGEEKPKPEHQAKDRPSQHREDIEQRLHDLASWQRKQKGGNF